MVKIWIFRKKSLVLNPRYNESYTLSKRGNSNMVNIYAKSDGYKISRE